MPSPTVQRLLSRGVRLPHPDSVFMADDVNPDRIAPGVVLHPGTRLLGARTSIGPESEIGGESPATIEDCQLGRGVSLKGGFFSGATFLDGANVGSAAHVRPGTLLEEEASAAHAVGLKQTVLLPFVTMGSLINFCDVLMAGGTSRKNHSEVGSSYIHFNFTPHQDKATASLLGDVPRGVFLDQDPIFLGGQGGLVGPCRIAYGCTIPAGVVYRQDALEPGLLLYPPSSLGRKPVAYSARAYGKIERVVRNNLVYIGNILALREWYRAVRAGIMSGDPYSRACYEGALNRLDEILAERIKRLDELAEKFGPSIEHLRANPATNARAIAQQESFRAAWPAIRSALRVFDPSGIAAADRAALSAALPRSANYLDAIHGLAPEARAAGARWLQAIVDTVARSWQPAPES